MNTLAKFKELKKQQSEAGKEIEERAAKRREYQAKERKELYNKFMSLINPFHNQTINKHKIVLKSNDKKNSVEMFIDKKLYTTFIAQTSYRSCNCSECADGQTGHTGEYYHDINSIIIKYGEIEDGPHFYWHNGMGEDEFVISFDSFMKTYDDDLRWNTLYGDKK